MSHSSEKDTPWKNGYWYNSSQKSGIIVVEGEKVALKNFISLDYPGIHFALKQL